MIKNITDCIWILQVILKLKYCYLATNKICVLRSSKLILFLEMMVNWKYSFSIPFYYMYIIWHFLPSQNFKSEFWIFIIVDFSLQFFDYYSVKTYKSSFHTTTMWCVPMNSIKTMLSQNVYLIIILAFSVIGKYVSNYHVWLMLIFKQLDI